MRRDIALELCSNIHEFGIGELALCKRVVSILSRTQRTCKDRHFIAPQITRESAAT